MQLISCFSAPSVKVYGGTLPSSVQSRMMFSGTSPSP
jgi:hypothetical protein